MNSAFSAKSSFSVMWRVSSTQTAVAFLFLVNKREVIYGGVRPRMQRFRRKRKASASVEKPPCTFCTTFSGSYNVMALPGMFP